MRGAPREGETGIEVRRAVGLVQVDEVVGTPVDGEAEDGSGFFGDPELGFVITGDEAARPPVRADPERPEPGFEERARRVRRAFGEFAGGVRQGRQEIGRLYSERAGAVGFHVNHMPGAARHRPDHLARVVRRPRRQVVKADRFERGRHAYALSLRIRLL